MRCTAISILMLSFLGGCSSSDIYCSINSCTDEQRAAIDRSQKETDRRVKERYGGSPEVIAMEKVAEADAKKHSIYYQLTYDDGSTSCHAQSPSYDPQNYKNTTRNGKKVTYVRSEIFGDSC